MKGLLTAFTILSFVAASSVPMVASADEMNHDQPMSDQSGTGADQGGTGSDHTGTAPAKPTTTTHHSTHHATHHATHHKRTSHHKTHHKRAKAKHHKAKPSPKEG